MEEQLTPEDIEMYETTCEMEQAGDEQLQEQQKLEDDENDSQLKDAAQAMVDKANQELSKIPQKIEDDLDTLNKTLKTLMNKNVDPKVDVNSPEFDINVAIGDFKKLLDPLIGAISPIESIVGKVPLIGDLMSALSKLTSGGDNGGLSMSDIKLKLPSMPEIPPTLVNKVSETCQTIQEFCFRLPMLLIDVIFQMLNAIFSMFGQIAGVIGVPSFPFPFNLVPSMPQMMSKVENFVTSAPSQVKDIVMGALKEKFAAALALSMPKLPEPSQIAQAAKEKAEAATDPAAKPVAPNPTETPPVESPVVSTPPVQSIPPSAPKDLAIEEVKEKWAKRFSKEFNYDEGAISDAIDAQLKVFDGSNEEITSVWVSKLKPIAQLKRTKYTSGDIDKWMQNEYNLHFLIPYIGYYSLVKANKALEIFEDGQQVQIDTLKNLGDKEVVIKRWVKPKK